MKNSLKEEIFENLKTKIINNELKPNEKINERAIAKSLNISTTPVKEALFYLEYFGFINIKPRKGVFVNEVNLKTIKDTFQIRLKLEPIIIDLTAKIKTKSFLEKNLLPLKNKFLELLELDEINDTLFYKYNDEFHHFFTDNCGNQFFYNQMNFVYENLTRIRKVLHKDIPKRRETIKEHIEIIDIILNDESYEKLSECSIGHIEKEQYEFFKNLDSFSL